jgi:NAD+ diphosphatase
MNTVWLIFYNSSLLLRRGTPEASALPRGATPPLPPAGNLHRLGVLRNISYAAYQTIQQPDPTVWDALDLFAAYTLIERELHAFLNKGFELVHWERHSQYCSACGAPTQPCSPTSKMCPACGQRFFPSLTPAVLALVRKSDSILLARAHNFREPFYSILAGYLEPGESLEECVRREVFEEAGITVRNITYFGSQTWPFPSTLMIGFIADYESGTVRLQQEELVCGGFYARNGLPRLPERYSLSRRMIDWWREHG